MLNVSSAFKTQLDNDKRNFLYKIDINLANGETLLIENDDLWSGSAKFSQATSGTGSFDVGAFIIGKLDFILNNMYGDFDSYDFNLATVDFQLGLRLENNNTEYIRIGRYVADEVDYDGYLISFECLDYAYYFEQPWATTLSFPTTAGAIIQEACTKCGITLATSSWDGYNLTVSTKPTDKNMTWLAAIGYAAQMCGQYAKMDNLGRLVIKWYDVDHLQQVAIDGSILDSTDARILDHVDDPITGSMVGETDIAWNALSSAQQNRYARINNVSSVRVGHYPILITGVKCVIGSGDTSTEYSSGTDEYMVDVSGNPFIGTGNANAVVTRIAENMVGYYFYTFDASYLTRPYYEAGDLAWVEDYRNGRVYCSFITNLSFTSGQYQESSCGAETPAKKQTASYTPAMKILAEAGRSVRASLDSYENVAKQMTELISLGYGMYFSGVPQGNGSTIYYLHDKETINESDNVWKLTSTGLVVSHDGGTTWAIDENGNALYNVITARGINADWINSGKISIKDGNGNTTFEADTATGAVRINATSFALTGRSIDDVVEDTVNGMDLSNVVMELDNSYQLISTDADGNYDVFPTCTTTAKVFYGTTNVTSSCAFGTPTVQGLIGTWDASTKTYSVTGMTADSGTVTISAIYGSSQVSKKLTVVKIKQGEDGIGIVSTSVSYKASSSATTVPAGTWSDTVVSANGQYLWTRTIVTYNDGTYTTSYSVSRQGIDGTNGTNGTNGRDGTNGTSNFVHIKYSPVANPSDSDITETPDEYIGICVNTTQADPTTASSYTWTKFKGDDGEQGIPGMNGTNGTNGTNGRDGVSSYVHFAYSTSADGHENFSTTNFSGATYLGVLTDSNVADSTNYADYEWSLIKGADGADGTSVTILGSYNTVAELQAAHPTGSTGDAYIVSGDLYVWADNAWTNVGQIQGPAGANGTNGTNGTNAYVHFAYSTSASGQENFSVVAFNGATYIGVRSDSTQADSTNYQDYTWSKMKGDDGTSVTITSTSVRYQSGTSATTAPTGTWQSTIPSVAGGNYLWTRTIVNYSDGTSTTSYSVARQGINGTNGTNGINGTNGTNGTSSYVHIKYSTVANPTSDQMTETPSDYIGLCIDNNEEDPTSSGAYTWTRWTGVDGTNGINGTNGTDGSPAYVHFAYAKSADGSQNFSNTYFDGAIYIGVRSDTSVADSTNYRDYTWSKMRGDDGKGITSITEYYGVSNSENTQPTSWSTSVVNPTASNKYLWNYNTTAYTSGNPTSTTPRIIGMYSANGTNGRGISSITEYYQVSSSSTTAPTSWSTSMVNTTTTNKYLWNYEKITYSDGSESSSTPRIIGTHGATGTSARTYLLEVSPKSTKLTQANVYEPDTITVESYYRDGTSTSKTAYSANYVIDVCVGNTWYENICSTGSVLDASIYLHYDAQASVPHEYDGAPDPESDENWDKRIELVPGSSSLRIRMMNGSTLLDQEEVALLVDASSVVLDQESVFLALTNGGHDQGIYLAQDPTDGETKVYINSSYIATGELVVGGYDNGDGVITLKDASNFPFGTINNSGILLKEKSAFSNSIYYGCDIKPYGLDFYRGNNNYGGLKVLEIDVQSSSSMDFVYDHMGVLLQSQEVQIRAQDGRDLILGFYDWHNVPLDKFVLKVNRANFNVPVYASQLHASNGDSGTVVIGNTTLYITDGIITAIMES